MEKLKIEKSEERAPGPRDLSIFNFQFSIACREPRA
jgi:hypothetical protein